MSAPAVAGSNRLPELAAKINAEHQACAKAITVGVDHAMCCGDLLTEAKANVQHGQWASWLAANTSLSERTAQRYMQLARERPTLEAKAPHVADLTIRGACELIAKPPEPLSAVAEAWRLMPDEGNSLCAYLSTVAGSDFIIITPSNYPEYYYVTHCWVSGQEGESGLANDGTMTTMRKPARWQSLPEVLVVVAGIDLTKAEWSQHPFNGRRDRNPMEVLDSDTEEERHEACLTFADAIGFPVSDRSLKPWPKNRRELRQAIKCEGPWA